MTRNTGPVWHGGDFDLAAANRIGAANLAGFLGIEFVEYGDDWLAAVMPVNDRTRQPFGLLHGGASVALAETVSSVAGTCSVNPDTRFVVGMEINANHIRSARSGLVRAVTKAEALGQTTQVWTIRITDEQDRLICLSRATLAVLDRLPSRA